MIDPAVALRLSLLAAAGAAGTVARYGVYVAVTGRALHPALATAVVNVCGCLLLGIAWSVLRSRDLLASDLRLVLLTGFLGAFTTFSALLFDSARLARHDIPALAVLNVGCQVGAGAAAMVLGWWVGRLL